MTNNFRPITTQLIQRQVKIFSDTTLVFALHVYRIYTHFFKPRLTLKTQNVA